MLRHCSQINPGGPYQAFYSSFCCFSTLRRNIVFRKKCRIWPRGIRSVSYTHLLLLSEFSDIVCSVFQSINITPHDFLQSCKLLIPRIILKTARKTKWNTSSTLSSLVVSSSVTAGWYISQIRVRIHWNSIQFYLKVQMISS